MGLPDRRTVGAVALVALVSAAACVRPFLAGNFRTAYQPRTKVVAVAPLANLTLEPNAPAEVGEAISGALRARQEEYTVTIQDPDETRQRIAGAGLSPEVAAGLPVDQLCRLLETDAIMVGTVTGFLRYGVEHEAMTPAQFLHSDVLVNLEIYHCADGELLWGFKVKKSGQGMTNQAGLRARVGGEVAKRFPYRRN